jgi:arsenate reductase (thioredoxin)
MCYIAPMRILILCTHNSARSQMAEGWARHYAGSSFEVFSAGTQATFVKPDAIAAMLEVGVDVRHHSSKTLYDLPDPWNFEYVVTVCDSAAEACPVYPAQTVRLHYPFTDPSGQSLEVWRVVRDQIGAQMQQLVQALVQQTPVPASYAAAPATTNKSG